MKHLDAFAVGAADVIKRVIDGPKVGGRFDALEQRMAALEKRPAVKFCGTWERAKSYRPGDAVVHGGGLWICRAETTGQPNQDFVGWTLAVKSRTVA